MTTSNVSRLALPTASQSSWQDAELGVIIHFDLQVFEPDFNWRRKWGYTPDLSVFNPPELDTDQWIATAKSFGAKYAVLVAKHCSGFSLWPTKAHDYHVGNTPWKSGKGDIVGDFIASCEKYGLKSGIYCSASANAYLRVDNPGKVLTDDPEFLKKYSESMEMQNGRQSIWACEEEQERYRKIVETQLTELWSNYGKLFEIWFDGGVLPPEKGGPDIIPIMKRFQPDAVVFGGPAGWPSLARFIGNERAEAPDPFWSATNDLTAFDGTEEFDGLGGNPDGTVWSCGEADMPNRGQMEAFQGGWFWREGEDHTLYSIDHLTECYLTSVGRNCNMLLGMVIDNRGLVPEADQEQFAQFGERLNKIFTNQLASTSGSVACLEISIPQGKTPNMVVLQEDIEHGERVRKYAIEAKRGDKWIVMCEGTCVGHKRIERFDAVETSALRLRVLDCVGEPLIRQFSAWQADPSLFSSPMDPAQRSAPEISRGKDGFLRLTCSNPNLKIRYTLDGSEPEENSPIYGEPIPFLKGGTVKAFSFVNDLSRSPSVTVTLGVDRSDWKVVSTSLDSPFKNNGKAGVEHLLDDNPATFWHTYHTNKEKSAPPHEVVLDMGETLEIQAFTLLPRDRCAAMPDDCEFYLSEDGENWNLAVKTTFDDFTDANIRLIELDKPMRGRYLRFVAKHAARDEDYIVVCGLGVVEKAN